MKRILCFLLLFSTYFSSTCVTNFENQKLIDELTQTGIYYYWNGGDLKKVEDEFFKGITLKGKYDVVEESFKKASSLDPNRLDLRFSVASTQIIQRKIPEALKTYEDIIKLDQNNFDARILHAGYSKMNNDMSVYNGDIAELKKINREKTEAYQKKFGYIEKVLTMKLNTKAVNQNADFIVTLGYALNDDGTMHEVLVKRLEQTYEAAKVNQNAKIIVTGGVQKGGITESYLMKNWLVEKGISKDRIIIEDKARDTVENTINSIQILKENNAKSIILISSASHIRRGIVLLQEAANSAGLNSKISNLVYLDYKTIDEAMAVSQNELLVIYRDLFRVSGIWAYPGIQR
ncbi:MAG: YdcF family protein [Sebaldella sp.]|nr:YdcF family protein [Sebaldella sp.]